MFGRRKQKLMRLEFFLFGLGCLGTVVFAWVMRPDADTSMQMPDGPYSFSVSGAGDLRYLEDMKWSTDDLAGYSENPVEEVSPVVEIDSIVDDASKFWVPTNEVLNPYLEVD